MSVSKRILKIGQYLAKSAAKIYWHFYSGQGVHEEAFTKVKNPRQGKPSVQCQVGK